MSPLLHSTGGDIAGSSLAKSGIPGEVFLWHDILESQIAGKVLWRTEPFWGSGRFRVACMRHTRESRGAREGLRLNGCLILAEENKE